MKVKYTAFNPVTELIDKISIHDVQKIIETDDSYLFMNDKGMLIMNDVVIIGEVATLKVFKCYMQGNLKFLQ